MSLLLFLATGQSAVASQEDLTELLSQLRQETTATVDFVEERYLSYLTEPVIVEGQLTYRTDGRLERQASRPKREKMTIEGRLLIIEQNAKDPPIRVLLSDHPPLQAFVAALRALLSGDAEALEEHYQTDLETHDGDWRLLLTPRAAALAKAVEKITVVGHGKRIATVEISETNGNRTLVSLAAAS